MPKHVVNHWIAKVGRTPPKGTKAPTLKDLARRGDVKTRTELVLPSQAAYRRSK